MDFEYIYVRLDNDRKKSIFEEKSTFKILPLFMKIKTRAVFELGTWGLVDRSKIHCATEKDNCTNYGGLNCVIMC